MHMHMHVRTLVNVAGRQWHTHTRIEGAFCLLPLYVLVCMLTCCARDALVLAAPNPDKSYTTLQVAVPDMDAAEALIRRASSNRACESTAMNSESSRSHVVFMLYIRGTHPPSGTDLQGCLCLVDLAGR